MVAHVQEEHVSNDASWHAALETCWSSLMSSGRSTQSTACMPPASHVHTGHLL